MSEQPKKLVTLLPVAPFVLELHSERMVDAIQALESAGFVVRQMKIKGFDNRYRIEDEKEIGE